MRIPHDSLRLAEFFGALRDAKFHVRVDHYVRIKHIFDRLGDPADLERLRSRLCPIFATTPQEQERFYDVFKRHYDLIELTPVARILDTAEHLIPHLPRPSGQKVGRDNKKSVLRWIALAGSVALLTFGVARVIWWLAPPDDGILVANVPAAGVVDQPSVITVEHQTADGELLQLAPEDVLVEVTGENRGAALAVDTAAQTYRASYIPLRPGTDVIVILVRGDTLFGPLGGLDTSLVSQPIVEDPVKLLESEIVAQLTDSGVVRLGVPEGVSAALSVDRLLRRSIDGPDETITLAAGSRALGLEPTACPAAPWQATVIVRRADTVRLGNVLRECAAVLRLSHSTISTFVDSAVGLSATARYASGDTISGQKVIWTSSDTSIAAVDSAGMVRGIALGEARITAEMGSFRDEARVMVQVIRRSYTGVIVIVIVTVLGLFALVLRRHEVRRETRRKGPLRWPLTIEEAHVPFAATGDFANAARALRQREVADSERFDVEETIAATIEQSGYPTIRYKRATQPPEYLVLIERRGPEDHHARLFGDLTAALRENGVYVTQWYFDRDPRVCFDEDGRRSAPLENLHRRFPGHRLVVFSNGAGMSHPATGRLHGWVSELVTWRRRAVMTPVSPADWGSQEVTLAHHFTVLPSTYVGVQAMVDHFDAETAPDLRAIHRDSTEPAVPDLDSEEFVPALRDYLGEQAFLWLSACAVHPELQWDLALVLAPLSELGTGVLTERNLLRLVRLPWFQQGVIPPRQRRALLSTLPRDLKAAARKKIISALRKQKPPKGSVSALRMQAMLLGHELALGEGAGKEQEKLLRTLPVRVIQENEELLASLEQAPVTGPARWLSKVPGRLGEALQRWTFRGGNPRLGLRSSPPVSATALLLVGAILWTERPPPRPVSAEIAAGTVGSPTSIVLRVGGRRRSGDSLAVRVSGANSAVANVVADGLTTYRASYTPRVAGDDTIHIEFNSIAVAEGAFTSVVHSPLAAPDRVVIAPRVASIDLGDSVALRAAVLSAAGDSVPGVPISWETDGVIAAVTANGLVIGLAPGNANVFARGEAGLALATITVVAPVSAVIDDGPGVVAGTITSARAGQPLAGARVLLVGTSLIAVTNENGYYQILNVPSGTYNVQARVIGYRVETITNLVVSVSRPITANFNLQPSVISLDDIVVTGITGLGFTGIASALNDLVDAERSYLQENSTYTRDTRAIGFEQRDSIAVSVEFATALGFSASAVDLEFEGMCRVWVGDGGGGPRLGAEGEVVCGLDLQRAVMRRDLRGLLTAEESHFANYRTYTSDIDSLEFSASDSVTVTVDVGNLGYNAVAVHGGSDEECRMWVGDGGGGPTLGLPGDPLCGDELEREAWFDVMRRDLQNLVTAQEAYSAANSRYATDIAELNYDASDDVIVDIDFVGPRGYTASARRGRSDQEYCMVQAGDGGTPLRMTSVGRPICGASGELWLRLTDNVPIADTLRVGEEGSGLFAADNTLRLLDRPVPFQLWALEGRRGDQIRVDIESEAVDAMVLVLGPGLAEWHVQAEELPVELALPGTGTFRLLLLGSGSGRYTLRVSGPITRTIQIGSEQIGDLDRLAPVHVWELTARGGEEVVIDLLSDAFDAYLTVTGAGVTFQEDDDSGDGLNARIRLSIPRAGTLLIRVSALDDEEFGPYTLRVTSDSTLR